VRYFSEETLFLIGAYIHASYLKQRSSYNCPRFQVQESSMFFVKNEITHAAVLRKSWDSIVKCAGVALKEYMR